MKQLVVAFASSFPAGSTDEVDYARDVHPILEARCFECHGPDKQKGKLRLDTREGLFESEDPDFVPIVPGDPELSTVFELISLEADDPDRMPPEGDLLSAAQIEKIRLWIEQGAAYSEGAAAAPGAPATEAGWALPDPAHAPSGPIDFDQHVRPVLSEYCFACHGPDEAARKADLRLDTQEGLFGERHGGRQLVLAGDVAGSALLHRVLARDRDDAMPPPESLHQLDERERWILVQWIEQGASWKNHWSFERPVQAPLPAVEHRDWPRNELDHFVLARMEAAGLSPSEEADRRTLLRRASLDLSGLPPDADEVDRLVASSDEEWDAAYEAFVDRLLGSIAHAEHQARYWLDAARYGDTHGLHLDNYREMWPYRDWVVQAFHRNLPYDQFTVDQLAGDLLDDPRTDQLVASGFNRAHVTTNEGGSIDEEVYVRNVVDRTSTTGVVFMGLSLGCAVCHDHKYDPITQKEFYEFFAFFNNLDGNAMDGNAKAHPPVISVPSDEQTRQVEELEQRQAEAEAAIQTALAGIEYHEPERRFEAPSGPRVETVWVDDALPVGAVPEGNGLSWSARPEASVHSGGVVMVRQGSGSHQHYFRDADRKLRIGLGDELFAWVWLDPVDPPREVMLQFNSDGEAGWLHRAYWGENLVGYGKDDSSERRAMGELPPTGRWVRLSVDAQHIGLRPGSVVHGMAFTQFDGTAYWDAAGIVSATPQEPVDFVWIDDEMPEGATPGGDGRRWQWAALKDGHPVHRGTRSLRRSGGNGLNQDFFTEAGPILLQRGDRLFAHVWLDPDDPPRGIQLQFNDGSWEHRVRWGVEAHGPGRADGADHVAGPLPPVGEWIRLEVDLESVGLQAGAALNGWAFTQVGGTVYWDHAGIRTWSPPDDRARHSMLAWESLHAADGSLPAPVKEALAVAREARSEAQARLVRDHFLRHVWSGSRETFDPLEQQLAEIGGQLAAARDAIPTTLVMKERATPREAYVLNRGLYHDKGEAVQRRTPAILPPMDPALPRNRLGVARWLTDPAHPLTARVAVNRFWQQFFGTGLVKTSEDFGNQGQRPSHPELLDWMAVQFVADGWDVRRTLRRILTSATYRQSSRVDEARQVADPANRLLSRGPRFRLDAESLRDQALALSGLLVDKVGGPGVKPPQPAGLWKAVGYSSSNTARFRADEGRDKVHRRTLYTFYKRTAPPPQMSIFDAPTREECCVRRERTNTPLQALLLMNDPQYVEAARALAERTLKEGGADDAARLRWAFRRVTLRPPSEADLADLGMLLEAQRAEFRAAPDGAARLIAVGETEPDPSLDAVELGSWTMITNLLLNLDEVVTKE